MNMMLKQKNRWVLGLSRWLVLGVGCLCGLMLMAVAEGRFEPHGFPLASVTTPLGPVWTDAEGRTLYINLLDRPDATVCTGACTERWLPHLAEARHRQFPPQGFSVLTRPEGDLQWAYLNRPLYRFVGDREPGDLTGHGMADRWWVAQPEARPEEDD